MAAAIQRAARKLAQAGHRRLFPRFTGSASTPPGNAAADQPSASNRKVLEELQKKKEHVYNLLAKAERDKSCSNMAMRYHNVKLLQQLSVQIEPRPNDTKWLRYQKGRRIHIFFLYTASILTVRKAWTMLRPDSG